MILVFLKETILLNPIALPFPQPLVSTSGGQTAVCIGVTTTPLAASSVRVACMASLDLVAVDCVELGGHVEVVVVARTTDGQLAPGHALMILRQVA